MVAFAAPLITGLLGTASTPTPPAGNQSVNTVGSPLTNIGAILANMNTGPAANGGLPILSQSPLASGLNPSFFPSLQPVSFANVDDGVTTTGINPMFILLAVAAAGAFFFFRRS